MNEIKGLLEKTLLSIGEVTTLFYYQLEKEGYDKFNETITAIEVAVSEVFKLKMTDNSFVINEQQIIKNLNQTMEALAVKDSVLLADILLYDLSTDFKEIIEQL
jgi:hypothetical protein